MDDPAVPRNEGVLDDSAFQLPIRPKPGKRAEDACSGQIRNPILHCFGHSSSVPQDSGEERLPSSAVGSLHYAERR